MKVINDNTAKTQVSFAPNIKFYDKLGANWHTVFFDIVEYLKSIGFEYSRTLMFVVNKSLTEEEVKEIEKKVLEIAGDKKGFLYFDFSWLDGTQSFVFNDK